MRPYATRPRHLIFSPRRDRDRDLPTFPRDRDVWKLHLETISRPRLRPCCYLLRMCYFLRHQNMCLTQRVMSRTYWKLSLMHYQWIYNNFTYAHTFGKNIAKMVSATVQPRVKAFQLLALLMLLLLLLLLLLKHCQKRLQIWQVNVWQRYLTTWLEVSFRKWPTTLQQLLYVLPSVRPVIRHCCWFVAALKSKKCKTLEK